MDAVILAGRAVGLELGVKIDRTTKVAFKSDRSLLTNLTKADTISE